MPTVKKSDSPNKKQPAESVVQNINSHILDEFEAFVILCRNAVNEKIKQLNAAGRNDYNVHKTISDKVLTDVFRGSKWSP